MQNTFAAGAWGARQPAHVPEDLAQPYMKKGQLMTVLDDWSQPFAGLHLY